MAGCPASCLRLCALSHQLAWYRLVPPRPSELPTWQGPGRLSTRPGEAALHSSLFSLLLSQPQPVPPTPPLSFPCLAVAGRAEVENRFAAKRERSHERQQAAGLLASWAADLDAARPCQLTVELFTQLLHAYGKCGQIYHVLALMQAAFGVRLPPNTAAVLGRPASGAGSDSGASAAAAAAGAAQRAEGGWGGTDGC